MVVYWWCLSLLPNNGHPDSESAAMSMLNYAICTPLWYRLRFFAAQHPNPIVCFVLLSQAAYLVFTTLAIIGIIREARKLILVWLVATWGQFLTLITIFVLALSGSRYPWVVGSPLLVIVTALVYHIVFVHYKVVAPDNCYHVYNNWLWAMTEDSQMWSKRSIIRINCFYSPGRGKWFQ